MIKLIDNPDEFDTFNKDDIFFIRIMSLLKAYSTEYNFALFYKQIDESENITAIISRLDNDYTVAIMITSIKKNLTIFSKRLDLIQSYAMKI
jgi:hypothetical protein